MAMSEPVISLKNVCVARGKSRILSDINFSVRPSQCCAVIGGNGSGKSTLIAVLSGYIWPGRGEVRVLGRRYGQVDLAQVREQVGLIESSRVPAVDDRLSVRETVATGLWGTLVLPCHKEITDEDWLKVDAEVTSMGLEGLSGARLGQLSTGERMKALIARALLSQPKLLMLDEPTAGLDMGARTGVVAALEKKLRSDAGLACVIVSHHLNEIPYPLDKVVLLKSGRIIAQGEPGVVLTSENLSRTFDCQVDVARSNGRYLATVQTEGWDI